MHNASFLEKPSSWNHWRIQLFGDWLPLLSSLESLIIPEPVWNTRKCHKCFISSPWSSLVAGREQTDNTDAEVAELCSNRKKYFTLSLDVRKFICVHLATVKSTSTLGTVRKHSLFYCETHENHSMSMRTLKWHLMIGTARTTVCTSSGEVNCIKNSSKTFLRKVCFLCCQLLLEKS